MLAAPSGSVTQPNSLSSPETPRAFTALFLPVATVHPEHCISTLDRDADGLSPDGAGLAHELSETGRL